MYDYGPLKESIDKFFRSASLKLFFENMDRENNDLGNNIPKGFDHPELRLASRFKPQMPSNLEHIYSLVMEELLNHCPKHKT